jgi:hypothetical protein
MVLHHGAHIVAGFGSSLDGGPADSGDLQKHSARRNPVSHGRGGRDRDVALWQLFISWFLGCFALAAIATVVNRLDGDDRNSVWISDSYQRARERFGPLVLAACCSFGLFLVGMAVVLFVDLALLRRAAPAPVSRFNYGAVLIGSLIVASMVSWLGMAIPLLLSENIGVWTAVKKSVKLSNGYEGFLFLLVIESLAGSYVAWYAVHYGLSFLFPVQLRYTAWYGWLVYSVSILASAAVQPPMFIGFSLLAAAEPSVSQFPSPE